MATNRQRTVRQAKRRITANITQEYLESLDGRDFLAFCTNDIYNDALSDEEAELLTEYKNCDCNFEKWQRKHK